MHILAPINSSKVPMSFFAAASLIILESCSYYYSIFLDIKLIKICAMKKVSVTKFGGGLYTSLTSSWDISKLDD
jgi:hypothetical protein